MSYCRFQNTLIDLRACRDALIEEEELSDDEQRAMKALLLVCKQVIDAAARLEK
jgi:hypothetical protein